MEYLPPLHHPLILTQPLQVLLTFIFFGGGSVPEEDLVVVLEGALFHFFEDALAGLTLVDVGVEGAGGAILFLCDTLLHLVVLILKQYWILRIIEQKDTGFRIKRLICKKITVVLGIFAQFLIRLITINISRLFDRHNTCITCQQLKRRRAVYLSLGVAVEVQADEVALGHLLGGDGVAAVLLEEGDYGEEVEEDATITYPMIRIWPYFCLGLVNFILWFQGVYDAIRIPRLNQRKITVSKWQFLNAFVLSLNSLILLLFVSPIHFSRSKIFDYLKNKWFFIP